MKITIYPKNVLEAKWAEDKKLYVPDSIEPPVCPRCGRRLNKRLMENALSRYANVMLCADYCGPDEALRDYSGDPLAMCEWFAVKQGLVQPDKPEDGAFLTPSCSFSDVFSGPKKNVPLSGSPVPKNKVLHSRSDYDGHKWWLTWHPCHEEPLGDELCGEINDFSDSLMELPEFLNLETLQAFCKQYARATSEPTEFNMYSETAHFYIWLRMITRRRDYNLYVSFYLKESPGPDSQEK